MSRVPAPLSVEAVEILKSRCRGVVVSPGDADFLELLHGNLWNRLIPDRVPQVLVRVKDEQDVMAAIGFAREQGLKVAVRGGGHNWCQPTLRYGGLLIDLSELNQVISIDAENRRAVMQPIISNRDTQKALNPLGLAYPSGHCPQVKLSGYLLGGGMAWNQGVWGSGTESVEAMEIVTADGKLVVASESENADLFWAARGAGYGFFGVVTRYHLRLYPLPKAIHSSAYFYSMDDAVAVGKWLGEIAGEISPSVELSLFLVQAPPEFQAQAAGHNGKVCMVTGVAFEDTPDNAREALAPLEGGKIVEKCLGRSVALPTVFEELFDLSGSLWPENARSRVEATFSNANPGHLVEAVREHVIQTPSPTTVVLFTIFTGPNIPAPRSDTAYSMRSRVYGGPWTTWWKEEDDHANTDWHRECIERLRPFNVGYYIGESDTIERPANAVQAYAPENWRRLADLRQKYDPDGIFFSYFDGFEKNP